MSTATATRARTEALEDTLMMFSWGRWARPRIHRELGARSPGWAAQYESGYQEESSAAYIPPIQDEYAEWLDSHIAKLPKKEKQTVICLYVYGLSLNRLPHIVRRSRHAVRNERDAALHTLAGALGERSIEKV